ncbi:MAG: hypothetical protein PVF74_14495, partial [Anaerolineales bacterium]
MAANPNNKNNIIQGSKWTLFGTGRLISELGRYNLLLTNKYTAIEMIKRIKVIQMMMPLLSGIPANEMILTARVKTSIPKPYPSKTFFGKAQPGRSNPIKRKPLIATISNQIAGMRN